MPNLIPIDFYTEGKPNAIYPLRCMQYCFSGQYVIFVLATKADSGEDSQMALVTVSVKTQLSQSVILKLSVLGYAIR